MQPFLLYAHTKNNCYDVQKYYSLSSTLIEYYSFLVVIFGKSSTFSLSYFILSLIWSYLYLSHTLFSPLNLLNIYILVSVPEKMPYQQETEVVSCYILEKSFIVSFHSTLGCPILVSLRASTLSTVPYYQFLYWSHLLNINFYFSHDTNFYFVFLFWFWGGVWVDSLYQVDIWEERKVFGSRGQNLKNELLGKNPSPVSNGKIVVPNPIKVVKRDATSLRIVSANPCMPDVLE